MDYSRIQYIVLIQIPPPQALEKHVSLTYKVLLMPHVDTITKRDANRAADVQMDAAAVAIHHNYFFTDVFFQDFIKLDTTSHNVDETVNEVVAVTGNAHAAK